MVGGTSGLLSLHVKHLSIVQPEPGYAWAPVRCSATRVLEVVMWVCLVREREKIASRDDPAAGWRELCWGTGGSDRRGFFLIQLLSKLYGTGQSFSKQRQGFPWKAPSYSLFLTTVTQAMKPWCLFFSFFLIFFNILPCQNSLISFTFLLIRTLNVLVPSLGLESLMSWFFLLARAGVLLRMWCRADEPT